MLLDGLKNTIIIYFSDWDNILNSIRNKESFLVLLK